MSLEPTVFIVDDDPAIRKSYRWLIQSVGLNVQAYATAREFLDAYDPLVPGCLVLDVRMPGMSGLELQQKLREEQMEIPVIIVTGYGDVPMAVRAMQNGAVNFIEKPISDQLLLEHIQRAIAENFESRKQQAEYQKIARKMQKLTKREREVMKMVVSGMSSKEIANDLNVSFKTVESHRAKIMKKMEARSVPHLIRMSLTAPLDED